MKIKEATKKRNNEKTTQIIATLISSTASIWLASHEPPILSLFNVSFAVGFAYWVTKPQTSEHIPCPDCKDAAAFKIRGSRYQCSECNRVV